MATLTTNKTASTVPAKLVHAGSQSISADYSFSLSLSVGDVIQMVRVPSGAVVTDVAMTFLGTAANTVAGNVGDGDSSARYIAATSLSNQGVVRATVGIPYSYSQDDTVDLSITVATSTTLAGGVKLTVTYKVDDPLR